ncbi:MAG: lytic transglycosylase domain-containing protein, partial [Candidatus Competibacteraceae bacterium]|nr:lytic transglycosylase domain-containing protein [Candidatus Competibacteraceae bacterium]
MHHRYWRYCLVLVLLWLTACASSELVARSDSSETDPFPVPVGLEPQVDFWRQVYASWDYNQAALHDDRSMLVYEVVELGGPVTGWTEAQRKIQRQALKDWRQRLEDLEQRMVAGQPLDAEQRALAQRIIQAGGGEEAIIGAAGRLRSQRGMKTRFRRGLELSGRYDGVFRAIFHQAGLPGDLAYLPHVESSFQNHARSTAGATGMWQFTRPAAKTYMSNHPALDERLDPVASARGAARYLRHALDTLEDWSLALTSYNHGITGMNRARQQFGNDFVAIVHRYQHRLFGFASRNFYAEFLAARSIARNPQHYFPGPVRYEPPLDWERVVLNRDSRVGELTRLFGLNQTTLVRYNPAWTRAALRQRVALPAGTQIWLPRGTLKSLADG